MDMTTIQQLLEHYEQWERTDLSFWGTAIVGEVGELCNYIKKFIRDTKHTAGDKTNFRDKIAYEIADIFNYMVLFVKGHNLPFFERHMEQTIADFINTIPYRQTLVYSLKNNDKLSYYGMELNKQLTPFYNVIMRFYEDIGMMGKVEITDRFIIEYVRGHMIVIMQSFMLTIAVLKRIADLFEINVEEALLNKIAILKERRQTTVVSETFQKKN